MKKMMNLFKIVASIVLQYTFVVLQYIFVVLQYALF